MALSDSSHSPVSTYRVQLHAKSTFTDIALLTNYFKELGISDLYLSPIFTAVPGSLHGYDVMDYREINPELGGESGFEGLRSALRSAGCGIILDFVPNHMGIAGMRNLWWREVLEYGPDSPHAPFFDIQWRSELSKEQPRVLVPLLPDHYGKVLERGELELAFDDALVVRYHETTLPLRPETLCRILFSLCVELGDGPESRDLKALVDAFNAKAPDAAGSEPGAKMRRGTALKAGLDTLLTQRPGLKTRLVKQVSSLNGDTGDTRSFARLHHVLEEQHYRITRWQAGAYEINYRRFFAIDTLVGLHMENPEVFREAHRAIEHLLANGSVNGLRIDHIDGLRQPEDYLRRVQSLAQGEINKPLYVLVEKILAVGEKLPETWPVHGTTGYEFMQQISGIFVDKRHEAAFDEIYGRFAETRGYQEVVTQSKRLIVGEMFANAVNNLGAELAQIVSSDWLWRDLTRHELTTAVSEFAIHLPVYRTYRRRLEVVGDQDRGVLEEACAKAIAANPRADPEPLVFLRDVLIGQYPPEDAPTEYKNALLAWVLTFQQYTGAIMAKSVEDTAFYVFNRLIALNEVGGNPGMFGGTVDDFHRTNAARQSRSPLALLATSTHDSKLSEDVRARLYSLSELSSEWNAWLATWSELTARHTTVIDGHDAPDALDRYRFFQALLGVWPLSENEVNADLQRRLKEFFRKAVDEAKRHTSILNRNEAYMAACDRFVDGLTENGSQNDFMPAFLPCAARIARLGMVNSLAQLVLKCTVPGVPDFYQGSELWDFSLVDPDNRRPVDFELRRRLQAECSASLTQLLETWRDGVIKMRLMRELLRIRAANPVLFESGSYHPVKASGVFADNVVSFVRSHEHRHILVAVPRLSAGIGSPPVGLAWDDTQLVTTGSTVVWRDLLTNRLHRSDEPLLLRAVFAELPFSILINEGGTLEANEN